MAAQRQAELAIEHVGRSGHVSGLDHRVEQVGVRQRIAEHAVRMMVHERHARDGVGETLVDGRVHPPILPSEARSGPAPEGTDPPRHPLTWGRRRYGVTPGLSTLTVMAPPLTCVCTVMSTP